jgi:hypothetical protein
VVVEASISLLLRLNEAQQLLGLKPGAVHAAVKCVKAP